MKLPVPTGFLAPTVSYTDTDQTGYAGSNGNINQDPLFVDPINSNFHIQGISPCINTATSSWRAE